MDSLFIAFPLSKNIKSQLERLCFGLPHVHWTEHGHFYLNILSIGQVDGAKQLDIQEMISKIHIAPFPLSLQSLGCFRAKKANGILWAGVSHSDELAALIKELTTQLHTILPNFKTVVPHVPLGKFVNLDEKKLLDYLDINSYFETESFLNDSLILIKSRTTPDHRTLYQELVSFELTPPIDKLRIIE